MAIELETREGRAHVLCLVQTADVLFEGFRPRVAERLGLGPAPCEARIPQLIYGRITRSVQTGPLATRAGHEIYDITLSAAIGPRASDPIPPFNLVWDLGSGALHLEFGLLCAVLEFRASGRG